MAVVANSAANVTQGKPKITGAVFMAPVGTALPTNATGELNEAFKNCGYISADGVTNSNNITSTNVKAWGGDVVLALQESREDVWKLKLIEYLNTNAKVLAYGDSNVSGTLDTGVTVSVNNAELAAHSFVFDTVLKGGYLHRIVIPNATVTSIGDIVYKDNDAIAYDLTLTASTDSSGYTHYEYTGKASD